jgi:hypothetical protein
MIATVLRDSAFIYTHQFAKSEREKEVAQICPRWNPLTSWMRQIEDFQRAG